VGFFCKGVISNLPLWQRKNWPFPFKGFVPSFPPPPTRPSPFFQFELKCAFATIPFESSSFPRMAPWLVRTVPCFITDLFQIQYEAPVPKPLLRGFPPSGGAFFCGRHGTPNFLVSFLGSWRTFDPFRLFFPDFFFRPPSTALIPVPGFESEGKIRSHFFFCNSADFSLFFPTPSLFLYFAFPAPPSCLQVPPPRWRGGFASPSSWWLDLDNRLFFVFQEKPTSFWLAGKEP